MTWKTALVGLPYGWAEGGVQVDPRQFRSGGLNRLIHLYTQNIERL